MRRCVLECFRDRHGGGNRVRGSAAPSRTPPFRPSSRPSWRWSLSSTFQGNGRRAASRPTQDGAGLRGRVRAGPPPSSDAPCGLRPPRWRIIIGTRGDQGRFEPGDSDFISRTDEENASAEAPDPSSANMELIGKRRPHRYVALRLGRPGAQKTPPQPPIGPPR